MMKMICDRCGQDIVPSEYAIAKIYHGDGDTLLRDYDLCHSCLHKTVNNFSVYTGKGLE